MASPVRNSDWLAWVASLVEGTPRRRPASAYPPDHFYCLLDELPVHLVPPQAFSSLRSHKDKGETSANPLCQVLRNGGIPEELASCQDLLKDFALQGTIAWVRQPEIEAFSPFWLGPRLTDVVDSFTSNKTKLTDLSDKDSRLLLASGILTTLAESQRIKEQRRIQIAHGADMFRERGYAPLRNLFHPFHVASLRRYYRYMIRTGMVRLGDNQSSRRYVAHNESVARFFHRQIASIVSAVVEETVKPSYAYLACYLAGSDLKKHTDREQCEFSVTLCLDFSPEPTHHTSWPIRLDTPRGSVVVYQTLGDGLVYRGTRLPHYRKTLPAGHTSTSVFFHYVPWDFSGPLD